MFHYYEDLGGIVNKEGKVLKKGLLYRGTPLNHFTEQHKRFLANVHFATVIDLRHKGEIEKDPDILEKGTDYLNYSLLEANISGATHEKSLSGKLQKLKDMETMEETYKRFLTDPYSLNGIRNTIHKIMDDNSLPVFYHCVTGKDRTGIITVLLLELLDMDKDTITETYLKTRKYYIAYSWYIYFKVLLITWSPSLSLKAKNMYTVQKEYIHIIYRTIQEYHTDMNHFLHETLNLSDEEIDRFRNTVLE